ncbi:MAG: aspartate-semialdehyde dehydrogenase [Ruminococcaceae bacterium]|nr:aspartate-semialdehyde dehydrogenase [Oscillospiraceae bacterium]
MKTYNVGILGATGAVGREMIKILEERNFPVNELRLLASARSVGKTIAFGQKEVTVKEARDDAFEGLDIVLGAAENDIAVRFAPAITAAGAVFVDNSSAFRLRDDVPLVVPEINPEDAKWHNGIISNPNCSTIITLVALNPINKISPIKKLVASTYQAVSGAGVGGIKELEDQIAAHNKGEKAENKIFAHQIAFNLIPAIGGTGDNGYTSEEMKLQNEGRKIMHLPELTVTCTCVRVPVLRSHSISATFVTEDYISVEDAQKAIENGLGVKLVDEPKKQVYPMPLDTSDIDTVYVGRIRRDLTEENGLSLFCCGDQIRKGAATNAVQIAELLIKK